MTDGAVLARRVAEAADAWLKDPADVGVYGRLVAAVTAWRAWALPDLEAASKEDAAGDYEPGREVRPVGAGLAELVERLRAEASPPV